MNKRVLFCLMVIFLSFGMTARWPLGAQMKNAFMPVLEEQAKRDSLVSLYQAKGMSADEAQTRADRVISRTKVTLRYHEDSLRPKTPKPGSIEVDRNAVIHDYTPEMLVRKVLLQSNNNPDLEARIQNVRFIGLGCTLNPEDSGGAWDETEVVDGNRSLTYFEKGSSRFPLSRGLLISASVTHQIEGPNEEEQGVNGNGVDYSRQTNNGYYPQSFDAALDSVAMSGIFYEKTCEGAILDFMFQPAAKKMSFDYVFGSEEYPYSSNGDYSDVFGFFVSGPYEDKDSAARTVAFPGLYQKAVQPDGVKTYNQYNIALLPNGHPVGINWTNWGGRGSNVPAAWIHPGTLWDTTGVYAEIQNGNGFNLQNIYNDHLAMNPEYHTPVFDGDPMTELNGLTTKLTATADGLIPGKWYHLKLGVANVNDASYGSAVFISNLDIGETESSVKPLPVKEGAGWVAQWDTLYGGAGDPKAKEKGGFTFYSGCDREFIITTMTTAPGNSNLVLEREELADKYLIILRDGVPLKSDTIPLREVEERFVFTLRQLPLPAGQEGKMGRITSHVDVTPTEKNIVVHYKGYNSPTTKVIYKVPTINYGGELDLGIQGGSPYLFRSLDEGLSWRLASEPISRLEMESTLGVDSVNIRLREPNCSCEDIIIPLRLGSAHLQIIRTITLPEISHATMDKRAGFHRILSRQDFELVITPHADDADKTLIVRTNRTIIKDEDGGLQVTKRDDGSYHVVLKHVTENVEITFDMVVSNEASIESGRVWTRGAELLVYASESQQVAIYTLSGVLTKRFPLVAGETRSLRLPNGVYLVRLGESNETYKVVIR